ncbi:L-threonylcarbamoyladenylate synthase [Pusillimonas sp. ANT_WB101]|uniref:L-threonylcarbamoyladenylate synthase n=1 Tax=Pusillimonas sp. ANT_WB101 TaxID=2597356 RepID=UPI0011EE705E|nr:L-threonylcarbamoyladenylate synthase [Pusillimonas sp. ANT_WB101]KAA0890221.1 threonylcarbamoyl-AMP synthase [Pusillimonas sp. ANT_WB101]
MNSPDMSRLLAQAAQKLAAGGLVAFPTETVYGLGGDAENPEAIAAIYAAKGRPANHPVIVHVAPEADLTYWAASIPAEARALIQAFWPGPLTLILPRASHIPAAVSGGQSSVGLRCPSHPVAQTLLREFARLKPSGQGGVAAPSANKFGQVSPTQAAHVRAEFPELGEDRLMVLEGGPSNVGIESTIVDVSRLDDGIGPVLLRPGHITAEQLADVLGKPPARPDATAPRVSGSLKAHYAPHTPLRLVTRAQVLAMARGELMPSRAENRRVVALVFEAPPDASASYIDWRVCSCDPALFARDLYAVLRALDAQDYNCIYIEQPPGTEAWRAVNDRIGRAAAAFG